MASLEKDVKHQLEQELKAAGDLAKKDKLTPNCMGWLIADKLFPHAIPSSAIAGSRAQCPGFAAFCNTIQKVAETSAKNPRADTHRPSPARN